MKTNNLPTTSVNIDSEIFNAVNELFRDNGYNFKGEHVSYTAQFSSSTEDKIRISYAKYNLYINKYEKKDEYLFGELSKMIRESVQPVNDMICAPVDTRCDDYAKAFDKAKYIDKNEEFPPLSCDVLMVANGANEPSLIKHISQLFISNPEIANTLSLFSTFKGKMRAFTKEQAIRYVAAEISVYYGSGIIFEANLNVLKRHIKNLDSIYNHSFIVVEPIEQ